MSGCPDPGRLEDLLTQASARFRMPVEPSGPDVSLPDPLTEREQAVLAYLPSDLTQAEIAGELFVSVNTVKTQIQAIYRKLGVSSRKAALRRATDLGLMAAERTTREAAGESPG